MKEIYHDIFIGNEQDYYAIQRESNWAILHCCKHPFHCQFVGYRGTLPPTHPNYALKRIENEMALNLVDIDRFSENYLDFNRDMFDTAFHFWMSIDFRGTKSLFIAIRGNRELQQLAYYMPHAWGLSNMLISIPLFKN